MWARAEPTQYLSGLVGPLGAAGHLTLIHAKLSPVPSFNLSLPILHTVRVCGSLFTLWFSQVDACRSRMYLRDLQNLTQGLYCDVGLQWVAEHEVSPVGKGRRSITGPVLRGELRGPQKSFLAHCQPLSYLPLGLHWVCVCAFVHGLALIWLWGSPRFLTSRILSPCSLLF